MELHIAFVFSIFDGVVFAGNAVYTRADYKSGVVIIWICGKIVGGFLRVNDNGKLE